MCKRILFFFLISLVVQSISAQTVTASIDAGSRTATMSNGIVSIEINSKGHVHNLIYDNKELIGAEEGGRFYFSYNDQNSYKELSPNSVRIKKQNSEYAEVVYTNTTGSLQVEQAFILVKGASGIYSYVIIKGTSADISLREMRVVYRVDPYRFYYGYVNDNMQGTLPSKEVMIEVNDQSIMDATYPLPDGSIYTKYDWANYIAEDSVHGLMSGSQGIWAICPSMEFINGGPMRQELTVHTTNKTPLVLQMLQGEHFGAAAQSYTSGDEKIYGPFFLYVNSGASHAEMIEDAKKQASAEKKLWPYTWLDNRLYPLERTSVKGRLRLPFDLSNDNIQVVLAQPDIDIYDQGKDYIFWSKTDAQGHFVIDHVRPGTYTLYAYATSGEITHVYTSELTVSGTEMILGNIPWNPLKKEQLLMEIGENDRLTKGFNMSDGPRAYGLYEIPPSNLTYNYGSAAPQSDWYYAQTKTGKWTVSFSCDQAYTGDAVLTASIAGASANPRVDVYVNNNKKTTWSFGNDAAVYRSAVLGGRHQVKTLTFPASELLSGQNTIDFRMTSVGSRGGLMYDYIKLEAGEVMIPEFDFTNIASDISGLTVRSFPNPFTDRVVFNIEGNIAGQPIKLSIFNIQGQLMEVAYQGYLNQGTGVVSWESSIIPAGLYFYRVETMDAVYSGKIQKVSYP